MKLCEGNGGTQCPLMHVLAVLQDSIKIGLYSVKATQLTVVSISHVPCWLQFLATYLVTVCMTIAKLRHFRCVNVFKRTTIMAKAPVQNFASRTGSHI